jgi:hypothetical protein
LAASVENANYSLAKNTEEVAPPCHQTMDDSEMEESQEDGDKKVNGNDEDEVTTILGSEVVDATMKKYMAKLSTPKDYAYKKLIRGAKNACLSE